MRAVRARLRSDDAGYTLVELLVAMVISSMVLAMAGAFFVNVSRATATAKAGRVALGQAALAIDAVRTVVTMAADNPTSQTATTPAVSVGTGSTLTVTSFANTTSSAVAPSSVTFALDAGGYLVQTQTAGVSAATGYWAFTGVTTTRRIAGPFLTGSGTPFFSYIDSAGAVMPLTAGAIPVTALGQIAFVRVTAKVDNRTVSGSSDPVVVTTSIGLTNVFRDVDASVTMPTLSAGQ